MLHSHDMFCWDIWSPAISSEEAIVEVPVIICLNRFAHYTVVGVQALNRKARYRGIVAGCQTLDEEAGFPSPVGSLAQIAAALQHAIATNASAKILQDRYNMK